MIVYCTVRQAVLDTPRQHPGIHSSILPVTQGRHPHLSYDGLANLVALSGPLFAHQFS